MKTTTTPRKNEFILKNFKIKLDNLSKLVILHESLRLKLKNTKMRSLYHGHRL